MPVIWKLKTKGRIFDNIFKVMFFKEIYGILYSGYLEFVFIAVFNLQSLKDDPDNNDLNSIYCYFMLTITLVVLPIAILYVFNQSAETLDDPHFM